jgi:hypothetical protein
VHHLLLPIDRARHPYQTSPCRRSTDKDRRAIITTRIALDRVNSCRRRVWDRDKDKDKAQVQVQASLCLLDPAGLMGDDRQDLVASVLLLLSNISPGLTAMDSHGT